MQKLFILFILTCGFTYSSTKTYAHCEIPCGIYDDSVRVKLIYEHINTIEKSMKGILTESEKAKPDYNQLIRWVSNKEDHAVKIQEIVSQYFLHQRIKLVDRSDNHAYGHYVEKLELLHRMAVLAMQAKQGTDINTTQQLRATLAAFEKAYFGHSH